jgi:hypothetical protein
VPPSISPPTATTLPPGVSLTAQVSAPLAGIFDDPSSPQPTTTFGPSWHVNDDPSMPSVPEVFLVEEQRPGWVKVLLPVRPNGSSGWIHAGDVQVRPNPYHIQVDIAAHQITVFNGTEVTYQGPVANGAPATPTPPGLFYTRVLLQTPDPRSVYGPFAYGLSAHSDALTTFAGVMPRSVFTATTTRRRSARASAMGASAWITTRSPPCPRSCRSVHLFKSTLDQSDPVAGTAPALPPPSRALPSHSPPTGA